MCEKCDATNRARLREIYPEKTLDEIEKMVQLGQQAGVAEAEETAKIAAVVREILDRQGTGSYGFSIAVGALARAIGMTIAKLPEALHPIAQEKATSTLADALAHYAVDSPPGDDPDLEDFVNRVAARTRRHSLASQIRH